MKLVSLLNVTHFYLCRPYILAFFIKLDYN